MSDHATLSPSSAETWMNCAASIAMQDGLKKPDTIYSAEGTAAHIIAARALDRDKPAKFFLKEKIYVGKFEFVVTVDMADAIQIYLDKIREYAGSSAANVLLVEQRVQFDWYIGCTEPQFGTSDSIILTGDEELQVHDLKFGRGHKVFAEKNKQMMIYALGAVRAFDTVSKFKRIRMCIHQPRVRHFSEWDCSYDDLMKFADEMKIAGQRALRLKKAGKSKLSLNDFTPGDKQCQWCAAKADCPAKTAQVYAAIGAAFEALPPDPHKEPNTKGVWNR